MTELINETTVPWILAGLGILVLIILVQTLSAWRQVKRSPYFFLRQQAERRLQSRIWALVGVAVLGGATIAYGNQAPPDHTIRMALIAKAKPSTEAKTVAVDELPVIALDGPDSFEQNVSNVGLEANGSLSTTVNLPFERPGAAPLSLEPVLPEEFDQFEPEAELTPDSDFTPLVFSTEINDDYDPVSPQRLFVEGFYTIYATFDYKGMAEGMEWAWVWRRNGEIVNGGNELWTYGDDGPGWIYYEPPEGFSPGQYTLEVWVNGELFQQASLTVEGEAANR